MSEKFDEATQVRTHILYTTTIDTIKTERARQFSGERASPGEFCNRSLIAEVTQSLLPRLDCIRPFITSPLFVGTSAFINP
jgi:hypothetical protein